MPEVYIAIVPDLGNSYPKCMKVSPPGDKDLDNIKIFTENIVFSVIACSIVVGVY